MPGSTSAARSSASRGWRAAGRARATDRAAAEHEPGSPSEHARAAVRAAEIAASRLALWPGRAGVTSTATFSAAHDLRGAAVVVALVVREEERIQRVHAALAQLCLDARLGRAGIDERARPGRLDQRGVP